MTRVDQNVRDWLEAEAAGRPEESDLRFRAVSRVLRPSVVPAGFADAVLGRIGVGRAEVPRNDNGAYLDCCGE